MPGLGCEPPAQVGEFCRQDCGGSDCASGLYCNAGVCAAAPTVPGIGDPCPQGYCLSGYCDASSGTCMAAPLLGQACGAGYLCDSALECINGTCQGAPAASQNCSGEFGLACRRGDFCDATGTCQEMHQLGDRCDPTVQMPQCLQGRCDNSGHCSTPLPPGSPCDPGAFECGGDGYSDCAVDSMPSGSFVWYCQDSACTYPTDGGSDTSCAAACSF